MDTQIAIQNHRVNFGYPQLYTESEVQKEIETLNNLDDEWTYEAVPHSKNLYIVQIRDEENEIIGVF